MKTFKLKTLTLLANESDSIEQQQISLQDGLVINREDKLGWLIEAFIDRKYEGLFQAIEEVPEIMIQVKITREENDPAFFITKIIAVNKISDTQMNVIFQGQLVDHSKSRIEELLKTILEEGYQGASILKKFKESI